MDLEREIEALRTRRRNTRPDDLHRLLIRAGFSRRFGNGDHWVYSHPALERNLVIDPRTPLYPAYVTLALRALENLNASQDG